MGQNGVKREILELEKRSEAGHKEALSALCSSQAQRLYPDADCTRAAALIRTRTAHTILVHAGTHTSNTVTCLPTMFCPMHTHMPAPRCLAPKRLPASGARAAFIPLASRSRP